MKSFETAHAGIVVYELTDVIMKNKDYLGEIDGAAGDGDHGVNMNKGFSKCRMQLQEKTAETSLADAFETLGDILLSDIGGSMGPLYGSFFLEMADCVRGFERVGGAECLAMLKAGLAGIKAIVPTSLGDKTLLDVLIPSTEAFERAVMEGCDFDGALARLKEAADKSWEATKEMVAKVGRARWLGERSRGFYDAGATSCKLILNGMADSMINIMG